MPLPEILQLASTFGMVGVIWLVQLVQYPGFAGVPAGTFVPFHHQHSRRISYVVVPLMTVELASGAYLALTGASIGSTLQWLAFALVVVLWLVTATVQVPIHRALARGKDDRLLRRLVATNWLRTGLWTVKGALLAFAYWSR